MASLDADFSKCIYHTHRLFHVRIDSLRTSIEIYYSRYVGHGNHMTVLLQDKFALIACLSELHVLLCSFTGSTSLCM